MTEFERKFVVTDPGPATAWSYEELAQGYLFTRHGYALRVRSATAPDGARVCTMTLKGPRSGLGRPEAEWEIPAADADALLAEATGSVAKRRHTLLVDDLMWTVDIFTGANAPLVLAEVEGPEASVAAAEIPPWCGQEVTTDTRYTNAALSAQPYGTWAAESPV